MSDKTKIEWTHAPGFKGATWNPVRAVEGRHWCTKISPGCVNCYAERMNLRFGGRPYTHGKDALRIDDKALQQPRKWRDPRMVFPCSMTDLFHESLDMYDILKVFTVMQDTPRHTYQVLTKRPENALAFCKRFGLWGDGEDWPKNVWLGVSVENQKYADERIPLLLRTPAAVRFVSYEPALGPVDFVRTSATGQVRDWLRTREVEISQTQSRQVIGLGWIIVGGESGPKRREFNIEWGRDAIRQCRAAGVACFVKQDAGPQPGMQGRFTNEEWAVKEFPR